MSAVHSSSDASPAARRRLWHVLIGFSLYWLGNALVVFPWLVSKALGIAAMMLSTGLWGYASFYCLRHAPKREWTRDAISMTLSFLLAAVVQDYLLFAVYRRVPDELYEPTTLLAYGVLLVLPIAVRCLMPERYGSRPVLPVTNTKLSATVIVGALSFLTTAWSMSYW